MLWGWEVGDKPSPAGRGFGVPHSIPLGATGVWDEGCWGGEWGVHAKGVMQGEPGGVQPGGYYCSGETEAGRREERGSGCS